MNKNMPILTIGIPILNGEKIIRKKLEQILSQSFQDFIILIYDNSTDSTPLICNEFSKNDNRIQYIHDEKIHGIEFAFNFLLQKAITKYFVWTAIDDIWHPDFLKKNIQVLEERNDVVGSIGQAKITGIVNEDFELNYNDSFIQKNYKKFRRSFRTFGHKSIFLDSYEKRAGKFLRMNEELSIYTIFRTNELQKSFVSGLKPWKKTLLNVLKYGNFNVVEEILWYWSKEHYISDNVVTQYKKNLLPLKEVLFPYYEYAYWCIKNLGLKFFIKNFDFFALSNFSYFLILVYSWIQNLNKSK